MAKGAITVKIDGQYDNKDINRAIKDLNALKTQADGTSGGMDSVSKGFVAAGAAIAGAFALNNVIDFLRDSMAAAIEDEKSMVSLAKAMQNVGEGAQTGKIEDFIKSMSLMYGVADDDLRPAFQRLVTATGDAVKSQSLLQTAMDISAGTGKDLTTVTTAMSKAANGNIGALTRLGVPLDANIVKSKDFGKALEVLNQKFGGQAAAAVDTYGGRLGRLSVAAGEAQETIGYALLKAVDDISESFGGTGGLVQSITDAGDKLATFTTGVGSLITKMVELGKLGADAGSDSGWMGRISEGAQNMASAMIPGYDSIMLAKDAIFAMGLAEEQQARQATASEEAFRSYAGAFATVTPATQAVSAANDALQASLTKASAAADKVYSSVVNATDALKTWQQAISQSGSMDKWKSDLLAIETGFLKVSKSMSDNDAAGLKNRETIRGYGSDLLTAVEDWGNRYDKTVTQRIEKAATEGKKLRDGLISAGFKASDVDKFLGGMGLWNTQMKLIASGLSRGQSAEAMRLAGLALGGKFVDGMVNGISIGGGRVYDAAGKTAAQAAAGARYAAQVNSPSKVWQQIGKQMGDGLEVGLKESEPKVKVAGADLVNAVAQAAADTLAKRTELVTAARGELEAALETARQAVVDWQTSMTSTITNGMTLQSVFGEAGSLSADALKKAWDKKFAEFEWFNNVLVALKAQGASDQLIAQVSAAGQTVGGAWGQSMLNNGLVKYWSDNLQKVADLGTQTAATLTPSGLIAGQGMAEQTLAAFNARFGPGGPDATAMQNLMTWLADSMKRTTYIDVITRSSNIVVDQVSNILKRAGGGPVSSGTPYMVGEKGPELFVPSVGGNIIPNSGPSGMGVGGNSYQITVQAGVGDPRQIGQQVVEYIRRFEQSNGNVFAPAA